MRFEVGMCLHMWPSAIHLWRQRPIACASVGCHEIIDDEIKAMVGFGE